mmetsp:Transcript_2911/g.3941  ORF Transcript_2911/g.3941 Transcript_2911/m.3941 type:complete len:402 (+) Transcript_2911:411-1616(+)
MEEPTGIDTLVMACADSRCDFKPLRMKRRPLGPEDVQIEMKYCGICHTDLHIAADHVAGILGKTEYPCVPGHELAGICVAIGERVTKVKVGDQVGVGCMVDSCHNCNACRDNREQNCRKQTGTYNGKVYSKRAATFPEERRTLGGYCTTMVVDQAFAILIPREMPLQYAGPIMCAGITMYDPLKLYGAGKNSRVGIVGLGGLGIMGIKLAKALGCSVVAISRTLAKKDLAIKAGATDVLASSDSSAMQAMANSFDLILNTIPVFHNYGAYQPLLKPKKGKQVLLGLHAGFAGAHVANKIRDTSVKMSVIGGIKNTQEVVNLCAKEKIYPEAVIVGVNELNGVFQALDSSNDKGKRYVLDIATLNDQAFEKCNSPPPVLGDNETQMSLFSGIKEAIRIFLFY